jgi:hypothetical protein
MHIFSSIADGAPLRDHAILARKLYSLQSDVTILHTPEPLFFQIPFSSPELNHGRSDMTLKTEATIGMARTRTHTAKSVGLNAALHTAKSVGLNAALHQLILVTFQDE